MTLPTPTLPEEVFMHKEINRRRFVAFAGAASLVGAAGCIGDEEPSEESQPDGANGNNQNNDGNGNSQNNGGDGSEGESDDGGEAEEDPIEAFDFPLGADESGVVTDTVVAGSRQFLEGTQRYRVEQQHDLDYADAPRDKIEITYDAGPETVHERRSRDGVEINQWVTPEGIVGRSADTETGRTGRWQSETVGPATGSRGGFNNYPFEESAVPGLLKSASFGFEEIVTESESESESESEQAYARYSGEIVNPEQLELVQWETARVDYQIESTSEGNVSMLLAESGAVHAVEYDFVSEVIRQTYEGTETIEIEVDGRVQFEYGELEALSKPGWADPSGSNDVRTFEITETSLGQTYTLTDGPALPGSIELEYSEFYITAQFGDDQYIDRYTPRQNFEIGDGVVAGLDEKFELGWGRFPGQDVFAEAERIEMSIYLYAPGKGRT
ncbi:MAG: hypothetical protein V5A36_03900, partial [Natronomonas sp.]